MGAGSLTRERTRDDGRQNGILKSVLCRPSSVLWLHGCPISIAPTPARNGTVIETAGRRQTTRGWIRATSQLISRVQACVDQEDENALTYGTPPRDFSATAAAA